VQNLQRRGPRCASLGVSDIGFDVLGTAAAGDFRELLEEHLRSRRAPVEPLCSYPESPRGADLPSQQARVAADECGGGSLAIAGRTLGNQEHELAARGRGKQKLFRFSLLNVSPFTVTHSSER